MSVLVLKFALPGGLRIRVTRVAKTRPEAAPKPAAQPQRRLYPLFPAQDGGFGQLGYFIPLPDMDAPMDARPKRTR